MTTETIRAHNASVRKTGRWTTASRFDVRASRGSVVLDLLLPRIEPGEIEIHLDIDHSMVKLLVPDGANIESGDLRRIGRGRVKDWTGTGRPGGRTIRRTGPSTRASANFSACSGVTATDALRVTSLAASAAASGPFTASTRMSCKITLCWTRSSMERARAITSARHPGTMNLPPSSAITRTPVARSPGGNAAM